MLFKINPELSFFPAKQKTKLGAEREKCIRKKPRKTTVLFSRCQLLDP